MASTLMSDAEIRRRKKIQGAVSVTTATLGLAALGSRGAGAAVNRAAKLKKLSPSAAKLGPKLNSASTTLTTTGAGVGGVGGYNFAAYTNAEGRKRTVKKFFQKPTKDQVKQGAVTAAKTTAQVAPQMAKGRLQTLKPQQQEGPRLMDVVRKHKDEVAKFGNWKTIDQRERTQRRDRKAMKYSGAAVATGVGLAAGAQRADPSTFRAAQKVAQSASANYKSMRTAGFSRKGAAGNVGRYTKMAVSGHRGLKMATGGAGIAAAGAAAGLGAAAHHKYNQTRINSRRRSNYAKKVQKTFSEDLVFKAFDPERARQQRMDKYSAGASAASGAFATGAALQARAAYGRPVTRGGKTTFTGLRSKNLAGFKGGLKQAGIAAGMAAGAAGAAGAAKKIRNSKRGSFTPLGRSY